ncbi:MAG: DUF6065 family protein [Pseudomonadota bacterium]
MITFYSLVSGGFAPRRASKSSNGTLPTDAYRYCEPLRKASSFGWYVYLPMEFWLIWDGSEINWTIDGGDNWFPLATAIQYPGMRRAFAENAPENCRDYSPPFLLRAAENDVVQVWTGLMVRTDPGYAVLARPPANSSWRTDYTAYEGVVETDRWFGPLFTAVRLRKTNSPIVFRTVEPFLQLQPLPLDHMVTVSKTDAPLYDGVAALSADDWEDYGDTVVRRMETRKKLGEYAVETRKRKKTDAVA